MLEKNFEDKSNGVDVKKACLKVICHMLQMAKHSVFVDVYHSFMINQAISKPYR